VLCFSDTLFIALAASGLPIGGVVCLYGLSNVLWFLLLLLLIVPVRKQDSPCMGLGPVSGDFSIPARVGLLRLLIVVMWPVVYDLPIYDELLDVHVSCMKVTCDELD
jgi:hypothetical protein